MIETNLCLFKLVYLAGISPKMKSQFVTSKTKQSKQNKTKKPIVFVIIFKKSKNLLHLETMTDNESLLFSEMRFHYVDISLNLI